MRLKGLYSEKAENVVKTAMEAFQDNQSYVGAWSNVARRSVAFANGDQIAVPYGAPVIANNQPVQKFRYENDYNGYNTNEIEPIARTLISYMTRQKPAVKVEPWGSYYENKGIAKCGEMILEADYDLNEEYNNTRLSASWGLTTGNVFAKDYWDHSAGSYIKDKPGHKTGKNATAILTAMSMTLDHSVTNFDDQYYIGESYIRDIDWAREYFDIDEPGYTGRAKKISQQATVTDVLGNLEAMKFNIPYISQGYGNRSNQDNKTLIQELYIRPNKDWPKGRLIIIGGTELIYDSPKEMGSPYFMPLDPVEWHPYTFFGFEPYVGRLLHKGLIEQLVPIQMRINEINRAILQNSNTLAKPNILAEEGSIRRGIFNGKGANVYTYKGGMNSPIIMQGAQLPPQFFNEKQQLIDQMVRIAGTNFVMQGATPSGVKAAAAIEMLLENANTQHSDLMYSWERFHERRYAKKLRLIHKHMKIPTRNMVNMLKQLSNNVYESYFQDFMNATDIADGLNTKIERGSMIPKSEAVKRRIYSDLAAAGALGPAIAEDSPRGQRMRDELIRKMDLEPLKTDESTEVEKAQWENKNMERGIGAQVSEFDNKKIHLSIHIGKLQSPNFLETASEESIQAVYKHIQEHMQTESEEERVMREHQEQASAGMVPEGGAPMPNVTMLPQGMDGGGQGLEGGSLQ